MDQPFNGPQEFARLEAEPFSELVAGVRRGLIELERRATGRQRDDVRRTRTFVEPALGETARAGAETHLAPEAVQRLRVLFEHMQRDGNRAAGARREVIETIAIRLRVLELRVLAIANHFGPADVAACRARLVADLWSAPARVPSPDDPDFDWRTLPAALHRAWIERLALEWEDLNRTYLDGMLKAPVFELSESREKLGCWVADRRAIAISGHHIATHAWSEVVDTLKHEMAHQFVSEVWRRTDAQPHGPEFRAACQKLRANPSGTARTDRLERVEDSDDPTDRVVARIRKLLALGRSPNQHEAARAMEKASELLARFNLDETILRPTPKYFMRWVGPILARRDEHHHNLATILCEHFFVRVVWAPSYLPLTNSSGLRMTILGTPENLDVSEYVHDYLSQTIEALWTEHRASSAYRGGRRAQFLAGVTHGFLEKLDGQKERISTETALVFQKDPRLEEHVRHVYPHLSRSRPGGVARGEDYHIGVEHGRELTLRMGVTERSGNRGNLLPPGSGRS